MSLNRFEQLRHHISEIEGKILSASELARLLNVSKALITGIEKGKLPPSPKVAARLEEKYDISREWYLTGEGEAPWEGKDYDSFFKKMDKSIQKAEKYNGSSMLEKSMGCSVVGTRILKTSEKELVDYFLEAGRNPEFRIYVYNVLRNVLEKGGANRFQEVQQAREKTIKPILEEPSFERTEVILKFPEKPADLSKKVSECWDQNELALHRWSKTQAAFNVPTRALEKFCRQVVGLYAGGKPKDIGDLLKDFMEDNKK